jgi:hypothetical protein
MRCPICLEKLVDPHSTSCCLNLLCLDCITTALDNRNSCPMWFIVNLFMHSRSEVHALYPAPLIVCELLSKEECKNELCNVSGSPEAMQRHECFFDTVEGKAISILVEVGKQCHEKTKRVRAECDQLRAEYISMQFERLKHLQQQDDPRSQSQQQTQGDIDQQQRYFCKGPLLSSRPFPFNPHLPRLQAQRPSSQQPR